MEQKVRVEGASRLLFYIGWSERPIGKMIFEIIFKQRLEEREEVMHVSAGTVL